MFLHRLLAFVGRISYFVYLWHQPVLANLRYVLDDDIVWFPGVVLTASLATVTHFMIERPMRNINLQRLIIVLVAWLGIASITTALIFFMKYKTSFHNFTFGLPLLSGDAYTMLKASENVGMPSFRRTPRYGCTCRIHTHTDRTPPGAVMSSEWLPPCFVDRFPGWEHYNRSHGLGGLLSSCHVPHVCWHTRSN